MGKKMANFIDSYSSLPLGGYLRILDLIENAGDDPEGLQPRIIAVLSGLTEEEVLDMPIADYMRGVRASSFLKDEPESGLRIRGAYECGGFRLAPVRDFRDVTAAQYIDFQGFAGGGRGRFVEILNRARPGTRSSISPSHTCQSSMSSCQCQQMSPSGPAV